MNPFDVIISGEPEEMPKEKYIKVRKEVLRYFRMFPDTNISQERGMSSGWGVVLTDLVEEGYLEVIHKESVVAQWYEYVLIKPIPENYE